MNSNNIKSGKVLRYFLLLAFTGGAIYWLVNLAIIFEGQKQSDFKDYYFAVKAIEHGANPYTKAGLNEAAGSQMSGRFLYPPITLYLFKPLGLLDLFPASIVFVALKTLAAGLLIALWCRYFKPEGADILWVLVLSVHVFGRPFVLDFRAGNISTFEELGLWCAFYFFLRGMYWRFCLLVAFTAAFKLTPILFLALTVLVENRRAFVAGITTFFGFLAIVLNPWLYHPSVADFFGAAVSQDERGALNPCMLSVIRDFNDALMHAGYVWAGFVNVLFVLYLIAVVGLGAIVFFKRRGNWQPIQLLLLWIFIYALCEPRFKNYSYILLIIPAVHVLTEIVRSKVLLVILLFLMSVHFFPYQQLVSTSALYLLFLAHHYRLAGKKECAQLDVNPGVLVPSPG